MTAKNYDFVLTDVPPENEPAMFLCVKNGKLIIRFPNGKEEEVGEETAKLICELLAAVGAEVVKEAKPTEIDAHSVSDLVPDEPLHGFAWQGRYDPEKTYRYKDVVSMKFEDDRVFPKGDAAFWCRKGCKGIAPPDKNHWGIFAMRGSE